MLSDMTNENEYGELVFPSHILNILFMHKYNLTKATAHHKAEKMDKKLLIFHSPSQIG